MVNFVESLTKESLNKEGPLEIFLTAGHPLTVSKGVILCQKNDAIQRIRFYIDSMRRRLVLKWSKLIFHVIKY